MFGNKSLPSRNFTYFARAPIAGHELVGTQMRLAHKYKNKLVEIERKRRLDVEQAIVLLFPSLKALEAQIATITTELDSVRVQAKAENSKERKVKVSPETKARIATLKLELTALRGTRKIERAAAFDSQTWKDRQEAIESEDQAARKLARAESMLYWGNYLPVEQAMGACRKGAPPNFEPWRGDGTIAIQLQGGLSPDEAFLGKDTQLRIDRLPTEGSRRQRTHTTVHIRVGSNGIRPVWASFPAVLHRPIPADCRIKWVYVHRKMNGPREEWSVRFVLARAAGWDRPDRATSGSAQISFGWSVVAEGLRVASWVDDAGNNGELVLPNRRGVDDWNYLLLKAADLQSIRDGHFNPARDGLADWIDGQENLPESFAEMSGHLRQWRSKPRLLKLIEHWRNNRFDGDAEAFDRMDAWAAKERHLEQWESANRSYFERQRREIYRTFAAKMAREYRTITCPDLNLKELQDLPEVENASGADVALRKYQKVAFISLLCQKLQENFGDDMTFMARYQSCPKSESAGDAIRDKIPASGAVA